MNKKMYKKIMSMTLAASLVLGMPAPANAAAVSPTVKEKVANGDTTIGIIETNLELGRVNVSYEVPLYITMVIPQNATEAVVPTDYRIKNTAAVDTGNKIGVTAIEFEKLDGGTFITIDGTGVDPAGEKEIKLGIGGVWMPALSAVGRERVDFTKKVEAGTASVFGENPLTQPKAIEAGKGLEIPILAKVFSTTRNPGDGNAVAQFKVRYIISGLDDAGKPIGAPYAGDYSVHARLGEWSDDLETWTPIPQP